jgi:hypothetical protein
MDNSALREEIKRLIEKIKTTVNLTPENEFALEVCLTVADDALPRIVENLTHAVQEIERIEISARENEQKLLEEYLFELRDIASKVHKVELDSRENTENESANMHEQKLLQRLDQT